MRQLKGTFWLNPDRQAWISVQSVLSGNPAGGKMTGAATETLIKITLNKKVHLKIN